MSVLQINWTMISKKLPDCSEHMLLFSSRGKESGKAEKRTRKVYIRTQPLSVNMSVLPTNWNIISKKIQDFLEDL
jgi:hypothetical protein